MKLRVLLILAALTAAANTTALAGADGAGPGNPAAGTCINPLAPDDDGDGIPNGLDTDYVRPRDGTGRQLGRHVASRVPLRWMWMRTGPFGGLALPGLTGGYRWGPGDGTGSGVGPRDGSGYGPGPFGDGTGDCDGTGPHGRLHRAGR
uniref:Uncharacterized protein n=1 Tax=Eiseniibacteriota bacterium TaxID=2212470 RepID=A0A832I698_UNCEI